VLETFAGRLIRVGVLARREVPRLTKYQIILARDQYRKNPSSQNMGIHQGVIEGDFALCISLYHGYELLLQMGVRSLFIYLSGIMDGSKGLTRTKTELGRNEDFMRLYQQLGDMFADTSLAAANGNAYSSKTEFENKKDFIYSHPKLRKLEEIVVEHFKSWKKGYAVTSDSAPMDTRVMIFSSFRDSVQEIAEMLSRLQPVVRVMTFVGHSTGKGIKGFTQKEQLEVVRRFREGGYNTLVSTCVGEEGLDIGEVDLIICFDAQKSPIRLVQRMGRTGRRRQGRIVVILAEGREERTYNQSQLNKRSILKAISGNKMLRFYQRSPRMIPEGINPKLHKMFITAEEYEPSSSGTLSTERRASSLQRKSAPFSCVAGKRITNWSLSPEEFEIWDRLYRIKESDGVKEPILPPVRFETLENPTGLLTTRELSLSEWRVWQDRPFPTSMVDHSDRCYHFISVMKMIDEMRYEQGDCSYELEIQPHLHIEDVNVQKKKSPLCMTSSALGQKARSARRAEEELPWNDSFDSLFDNEEFTDIPQETPAVDHPLTNNPSNQEEIAEVPLADQAKQSLRGQDFGRSAVGAPDSPLGRPELADTDVRSCRVSPAAGTGSESEEEIVFQRKNRGKKNVLKSPEVESDSDFESAIRAVRKRRHPLNMSDASSDDSLDYHKSSRTAKSSSAAWNKPQPRRTKRQRVKRAFTHKEAVRQFLDEEAELSQEDADGVSSDESDDTGSELNSSLAQFLNDDAEVTQVLNDCEMRRVYLQSVRSPALGNRYKMVHRELNHTAIFSQIPEQDQDYAEDSFCVAEEEEEVCQQSGSSEEEECVNFDLLNNESFTSGRKQYLTRRRKKLNQARGEETCSAPVRKKKPSQIVVLSDSSEEETNVSKEKPMEMDRLGAEEENVKSPKPWPSVPSAQHRTVAGDIPAHQSVEDKSEMLLGLKASVSEVLDFHPEHRASSPRSPPAVPGSALGKEDLQAPTEDLQVGSSLENTCRSTSVPPRPASTNPSAAPAPLPRDPPEKTPSLCILADSREISSGAEVISSLKALHRVKVQVCSLSSSDYIVSNRMAVERRFLSELLNSGNRSKVTRRIQRLQSVFERVCVIVEKDRLKAGDASRPFQRTQYYDGVLAALVQAGVRILFSSCQEETATLLKDLALVEQRKHAAICVPTEVEGHKQEMLNFYLSIPDLSYLAALNMCHHFRSLKQMANSSPLAIAAAAQVSLQKAEEIYPGGGGALRPPPATPWLSSKGGGGFTPSCPFLERFLEEAGTDEEPGNGPEEPGPGSAICTRGKRRREAARERRQNR
ncbi:PREDICTED: Fanconi anemia group M protein, partial [Buceros rhinoceros silvestris]|uniref:Fanconi anemia group M protein n=1 Tax=Buceros rhinoceros silvestris TaxID=175836 RepID=UPI000528BF99